VDWRVDAVTPRAMKTSPSKLDIITFKLWLQERGSEFYASTNPYEVLRFNTPSGVGLVFRNDKTAVSAANAAAKIAIKAFYENGPWRAVDATKRIYISPQRKAIMARDGDKCVYCERIFTEEFSPRIEHVVPVTAGGPNHLSNLALACEDCDKAVGTKSAAEKIRFAVEKAISRRAGQCS
jgi:hypothetical protein